MNLILLIGGGSALVCLLWLVVRGLRYKSSRALILDSICWLWGIRSHWIDDPVHARLVLQASNDKGFAIERLFATPAWAPVLSLESVDGAQWQRMKKNYLQLAHVLPSNALLQQIAARHLQELLTKNQVIDAKALSLLTISCFYEWLFEKRFFDQEDWTCVNEATWEWRKEIAMKGKGNKLVKQQMVDWYLTQVKNCPKLYAVFGDKWANPEYYSCLLQPFVISPSINICDIAVAVTQLHKAATHGSMTTTDLCYLALQTHNPFPVLERYLPDGLLVQDKPAIAPNTQVFIALDELGKRDLVADPQYRALVFGNGPRACPGKSIALNLMTTLFGDETLASPLWKPEQGHEFSGRNNDGKETPQQVLYLVGVILKAMVRVASTRVGDWLWSYRLVHTKKEL